jgi:hypothetical protein
MTLRKLAGIVALFLLGCGHARPDASRSDSATAATTRAAVDSPLTSGSTTPKPACPRTGLWALCSLEKRLTQSGFVVNHVTEPAPRRAGFSVGPVAYKLGRSRLEVFIYADSAAARRDVAKLDSLTASPRGAGNVWGTAPTFVHSGNLLAVFLTDSPQQAERLSLALTAGAPQP